MAVLCYRVSVPAPLHQHRGSTNECTSCDGCDLRMKALVYTLVRTFEFDLAVSPDMIVKHSAIVQRPLIRGEESKGGQMPMFVKLHQRL